MRFTYGFNKTNTLCSIRINNCTDGNMDAVSLSSKIFNNERWQPGRTAMILHISADCVNTDLDMISGTAVYIAKNKPRKVAAFCEDKYVKDANEMAAGIFRAQKIDAKTFEDMQELMNWVEQ